MANRSIGVTTVVGRAVMIPHPTATLLSGVKKFFVPTRSAPRFVGLSVRLGLVVVLWSVGSKKSSALPPLSYSLVPPDPAIPTMTTLELDELWTFVVRKSNQAWIWLVLCRVSRQIVAAAVGPRTQEMCRTLWERIPAGYRVGRCYSDFLQHYLAVILLG
ncbi:MAG: hypothetical protein H7Z42_16785 [Roseiflexaceae bacterium]|nr:hypothetical protein [Roseiflexaceae bacterium]